VILIRTLRNLEHGASGPDSGLTPEMLMTFIFGNVRCYFFGGVVLVLRASTSLCYPSHRSCASPDSPHTSGNALRILSLLP